MNPQVIDGKPRSPFYIVENFLSPLLCEEIVDNVPFAEPDMSQEGRVPLVSSCTDEQYQDVVYQAFKPYVTELEQYYNYEHKGTEYFEFEWLAEKGVIPVHAENAEYIEEQWVQTKQRDFTGVIFLTDFNDKPPFDNDFECYGGKLEFLNHQFGFNPVRGTMVIFPSEPRFCNASSEVLAGDLYQIRFHIAAKKPFIYNPKLFPGNFRTWF